MTEQRRTALVTGANRGIGLAIARGLAERDIHVLAGARSVDKAQEAVGQIDGSATGVALDLSEPGVISETANQLADHYGPIDILVNNAGVLVKDDFEQLGLADFVHSLQVHLIAAFELIQVLGVPMKERGCGRIVNMTSGWGAFAENLEGPPAYAISKAGLNALTVKAAQALGEKVKVNSACPGWVRTDMGGDQAPNSVQQGADTPIWLATLPDDGPTGGFFRKRRPIDW
ncbi:MULTISPECIES: SDR family NAD(P)-dependent oxidoreductase [unclassified Wenzhouxiangella]|uniref:SDR family NAD(P)-dependent oxidoreductase n=1 Tax=unclassified Wenzhouxiangella TaxID=2613841 RepID=UPI000E32A7CD|nr:MULTISPECIES: SDR family NAD(P)-dependent oxidoreductase [unclassified Wenzhouxiangella]RFF28561.1 SDR family NAD(P)-dependent oxidoreductase [Wenzhouxiangella sp. 15181]RFP70079.1 SDR family NAD(P)-dependent oxidoreductase [Wenzhouxiangella sp. 15190]